MAISANILVLVHVMLQAFAYYFFHELASDITNALIGYGSEGYWLLYTLQIGALVFVAVSAWQLFKVLKESTLPKMVQNILGFVSGGAFFFQLLLVGAAIMLAKGFAS